MSEALHLVCPRCDALNRIPAVRLGDNPKCGQCHRPLFSGHPVELTAVNFHKHLTHSDIPMLADFWAPWCGPCKMMAPQFAQAAAQYGIRSIPTLALFKGGHEVARQSGAMSAADIVRWVQGHI